MVNYCLFDVRNIKHFNVIAFQAQHRARVRPTRPMKKRRRCYSSYFGCHTGHCIPRSWLCDGISDCVLGEDEKFANCKGKDLLEMNAEATPRHLSLCVRGTIVTSYYKSDVVAKWKTHNS